MSQFSKVEGDKSIRMKMTRSNRLLFILAFLVAISAFVVFLPSLQNDFVNWDDDQYVYKNPIIRKLNLQFFIRVFSEFHASGNWHPLTLISHAIDYAVWGLNPLGHHLTNNIIHALNTFLVVLLAARLMETGRASSASADPPGAGGSRSVLITAAITGLLFGIHPIHVESVAWVSERKDVLCAMFYLLSVMSYMKYAKAVSQAPVPGSQSLLTLPKAAQQTRPFFFALGFFILALMSKPMAVTLPVVLLILDWYPFQRLASLKSLKPALIEKLPFFALSLASAILTFLAQKAGGAMTLMESLPLSVRLSVAAKSIVLYLWKMILPLDLLPYYPYPEGVSLISPEYISFIVLVIGITLSCIFLARKYKLWLSLWGYYLVTLLPVLGIVQVGSQAMADRYTYLSGIGPFLIMGLGTAWLMNKAYEAQKRAKLLKLATASFFIIIIIPMTILTVKQINVWENSFTLWSYVIKKQPGKVLLAYNNRGLYFGMNGDFDRAIEDFSMAVKIDPKSPESCNNRGFAYYLKGEYYKALIDFNRAISLDNYYIKAYLNRANLYLKLGWNELAFGDFQRICKFGYQEYCNSARAPQSSIMNDERR